MLASSCPGATPIGHAALSAASVMIAVLMPAAWNKADCISAKGMKRGAGKIQDVVDATGAEVLDHHDIGRGIVDGDCICAAAAPGIIHATAARDIFSS